MNAKILNWISAIVLIINMLILIGYTTYRIVNRRVI